MLQFNKFYFLLALFLFLVEVLIAMFVNDQIVRPYGGDFLVVIMLYYLVRSFVLLPVNLTAFLVLAFAYSLETFQNFNYVEVLGLEKFRIARIVLGTSFEWGDMVAYTLGILFVVIVENKLKTSVS
ncbi:ribosomal maturation YjgA family protein [Dyadobacter psychrotolerans]|uniref:DUF2809 domain-containing protein n=1 Tax=Dyadobacter psychrotolerans TaxID=2541721 RepID=A0A4R5E2J3_9BACT|nr:DUF2809 domain-containing protein [Dyadobacter psychrotolerans]TDE18353.1 DUF2809 domain-containing protein [Dyadobacter psychrotolerans]